MPRPSVPPVPEPGRRHRGPRRWIAVTGATIAALAGLTAVVAAASARDAPAATLFLAGSLVVALGFTLAVAGTYRRRNR